MVLALFCQPAMADPKVKVDSNYARELAAFRQQRVARLTADDGWVTLVARHWLKDGTTRLGSDAKNDLLLPHCAPSVGRLLKTGSVVRFEVTPGVTVLSQGKPV